MSADNWTQCPKCFQRHRLDRKEKLAAAKELYGKVPADEYAVALESSRTIPVNPEPTLQEDYELGTEAEGGFAVRYGGHCEKCGFTFKFNHSEDALKTCTMEKWDDE